MVPVSGWAGHFVHGKMLEGTCFIVSSEELPAHYLLSPQALVGDQGEPL